MATREEAIALWRQVLDDPDPEARQEAEIELGKLGDSVEAPMKVGERPQPAERPPGPYRDVWLPGMPETPRRPAGAKYDNEGVNRAISQANEDFDKRSFLGKAWGLLSGDVAESGAAALKQNAGQQYRDDLGAMEDLQRAGRSLAAGGIAGHVVAGALPAAGTALQRVENAAFGGGASAGAESMVSDLDDGATVPEAIGRAGEPALIGSVMGAGIQGAGEGARGLQKAIRKDPWLSEYGRARESGILDDPEVKSLPGGRKGATMAAARAQQAITQRNSENLSEAGRRYGAEKSAVIAETPNADPSRVVDTLTDLSSRNRTQNTAKVRDKDLEAAIQETFDLLDIDTKTGKAATEDMIKASQYVSDRAEFGAPPTKENRPFREIHASFSRTVNETSPRLAAANKDYAAQKGKSERLNDVLYSTEEANIDRGGGDIRAAKERTGTSNMRYLGDQTDPGLVRDRQLREVLQGDPVLERQRDLVLATKARAATAPGTAKVPMSLTGLMQIPGAPFVAQNARFLGGRVVDPAMGLAADAASAGARVVPPLVPPILGDSLYGGPEALRAEALINRKKKQP